MTSSFLMEPMPDLSLVLEPRAQRAIPDHYKFELRNLSRDTVGRLQQEGKPPGFVQAANVDAAAGPLRNVYSSQPACVDRVLHHRYAVGWVPSGYNAARRPIRVSEPPVGGPHHPTFPAFTQARRIALQVGSMAEERHPWSAGGPGRQEQVVQGEAVRLLHYHQVGSPGLPPHGLPYERSQVGVGDLVRPREPGCVGSLRHGARGLAVVEAEFDSLGAEDIAEQVEEGQPITGQPLLDEGNSPGRAHAHPP